MGDSSQKAFIGVIALGVSCISIELVTVSRYAVYWNRCLDSTLVWINEVSELNGWTDKAKDSLAVGVCNGAVYESNLKTDKSR